MATDQTPSFERDDELEQLRADLRRPLTSRVRARAGLRGLQDEALARRLNDYEAALTRYLARGNDLPDDVLPPRGWARD